MVRPSGLPLVKHCVLEQTCLSVSEGEDEIIRTVEATLEEAYSYADFGSVGETRSQITFAIEDCFRSALIQRMGAAQRVELVTEVNYLLATVIRPDLANALYGTPDEVVPPVGSIVATSRGVLEYRYYFENVVHGVYTNEWSVGGRDFCLCSFGDRRWCDMTLTTEDSIQFGRLPLFQTVEYGRTADEMLRNNAAKAVGPYYNSWSILLPFGVLVET